MSTINQRAAFAVQAQKDEALARKKAKGKSKGKKKMDPASRKGKNKFRY